MDAAALNSPAVDTFCSSSAWALSAHEAFHPEQELFLYQGATGYLVLARGEAPGMGRYLSPLEAMWGLSSPLLGPSPMELGAEAAEQLLSIRDEWDGLWLCGLAAHSHGFVSLAMGLGEEMDLYMGPTTRRHVASLEGGVDGFLSRRSSSFRRNLRRAARRAEQEGVTFRWLTTIPDEQTRAELYARALDVDDRSWKGRGNQGLNASDMALFYDRITLRLLREQRLRFVFAERDGQTVAMGFGGCLGTVFRGLQMSYDDDFRHLSLGNLVQWCMIQNLVSEGVEHYDLGTDIGYKARWGEPGLETVSLVARR